jgi:hypothetical protein
MTGEAEIASRHQWAELSKEWMADLKVSMVSFGIAAESARVESAL